MDGDQAAATMPGNAVATVAADSLAPQKRFRSEDGVHEEVHVVSRIVVRKPDFGKIIGKGGVMVNTIKAKCGANIKGNEIDEENRIVTMSGTLKQVLDCFDLITELLHNIYQQASPFTDQFSVHHLIEHSKAGRVVGVKGGNINAMKTKSGCVQIRIMKDPIIVNSQSLRILIFEGSLQTVRRAHYLTQELLLPEGTMETLNNELNVIPLGSVASYGVSTDTVRQLTEVQSYLNEYGLKLTISTMAKPPASSPNMQEDSTDPNRLEFYIPKLTAGSVIGKGASNIKAIMEEFDVSIYVDRDEYQNMRKVVIRSENPTNNQSAKDKVLLASQASEVASSQGAVVQSAFQTGGGDDNMMYGAGAGTIFPNSTNVNGGDMM